MVVLNADGTALGAPVGGATSANQTNGSQKTQIVDAGGDAVTVTGGKLDVNASIDTTGLATSAKQDTIIGHVDGIETSLTSIDGKITAVNTGAVVVSSSALPSGASTAAKQPALGTAGTASADVITVQGIASMTALKVDGSAVTQPVSGTVAVTQSGTWDEVGINDSGNSITIDYNGSAISTSNAVPIQPPASGYLNIAIDQTGNNNAVDVLTLPALAAGTNAIGKLLPPDIDITTHTNYAKKYYTNAGAVTDGIIWSPAAGKRWHVVSIIINTSAATTVTLEDDKSGGDEVVLKLDLAANSGIAYNFTEHYPLASGEDAADLLVTTSAGNIYITCVGYEI